MLLLCSGISAQYALKWEMLDNKVSSVKTIPADGKSILVFESDLELEFESSFENLEKPLYEGGKYFLTVNSGAQAITIGSDEKVTINFGQLLDPNTLPALASKSVKYFKITKAWEFDFFDISEKEFEKGNVITPIGPNESDAYLEIRLYPRDMLVDIVFEKKEAVTKLTKSSKAIEIFFKPGEYNVTLISKKVEPLEFRISLGVKDVKIFALKMPLDFDEIDKKIEKNESNEPSTIIKDKSEFTFQKFIGIWGFGTEKGDNVLLELKTFDKQTNRFSGVFCKNGIFSDLTAALQKSENNQYTVFIDIKPNSLYKQKSNLSFSMDGNLVNGHYVFADNFEEVVLLKVNQPLPKDETATMTNTFNVKKNFLLGIWSCDLNSFVKNIEVIDFVYPATLKAYVNLHNGDRCFIESKINETNDSYSIFYTSTGNCFNTNGTLSLIFSKFNSNGNFITNDGDIYDFKFTKNSIASTAKQDKPYLNAIGIWRGKFAAYNIVLGIEKINSDGSVLGYSIINGKRRPLKGIVMVKKNYFALNEPGDLDSDGVYKFTFNENGIISGLWEPYNKKLKTINYTLTK